MRNGKATESAIKYPGQPAPAASRRITVWVYGLAALLILLSTASLTFVAQIAWREADRRALESEQLRMTHTLQDLHRQVVRSQMALAQWDKSFQALQPPVDTDFIEEEMIPDLWEDFGLDRTFLIAGDGELIAQATEGNVRFGKAGFGGNTLVRQLADTTRQAIEARRKRTTSAFSGWSLPQSSLIDLAAWAFTTIDGRPAFLSAVPVLPDSGRMNASTENPAILVNAVYLEDDWVANLNQRLNFKDLRFFPGVPERMHPTNHPIYNVDGSVFGYFRWDHAKPGHEIWLMALPMIVLLATLIAVVAFSAATRISRLTASLEESERRNHHFARHDALTGLPNRHHFSDCLAYLLDTLPESGFAVLACDLDRFKPVNDTYGHEVGDRVLCCVAQKLLALVGDDGFVSRVGGDEFIILLSRIADKPRLATIADRIRSAIEEPMDLGNGQKAMIGISIGIACAPECGTTEKELFRMADMALYRVKESGRNGFEFACSQSDRAQRTETAAQ